MYIAVAYTSVKNDKMIVICHRETKELAEERFREVAKKRKRKFVDAYIYRVDESSRIENARYLTIKEALAL